MREQRCTTLEARLHAQEAKAAESVAGNRAATLRGRQQARAYLLFFASSLLSCIGCHNIMQPVSFGPGSIEAILLGPMSGVCWLLPA